MLTMSQELIAIIGFGVTFVGFGIALIIFMWRLFGKIDDQNKVMHGLEDRISSVETHLSERISGVETRLGDRISGVDSLKMTSSRQTSLPYCMGNAGDLLKHGVLAEFICWRSNLDAAVRFLDLFGGEPFCDAAPDEIVKRVVALTGSALREAQSEIYDGRYYGSGKLVQKQAENLEAGNVCIFVADSNPKCCERLQASGLRMLDEEFPFISSNPEKYDAYTVFEKLIHETEKEDLALIDPYNDFLRPKKGHNKAEKIVPQMEKMAKNASVLLFALNLDPHNWVGQKFDGLLKRHLGGALIMTCPPLPGSRIKGESGFHADVVLASHALHENSHEVAVFRNRLDGFAKKLADVLGLSGNNALMLRPRVIGEGGGRLRH